LACQQKKPPPFETPKVCQGIFFGENLTTLLPSNHTNCIGIEIHYFAMTGWPGTNHGLGPYF